MIFMIYNGEPPKKPREINTGIIDEFLEYIGGIIIMFASIPLAGKLNRSIFHMTNDAARFIFMLIVMAVMYLGIYNLLWGKLICPAIDKRDNKRLLIDERGKSP